MEIRQLGTNRNSYDLPVLVQPQQQQHAAVHHWWQQQEQRAGRLTDHAKYQLMTVDRVSINQTMTSKISTSNRQCERDTDDVNVTA